MECSEGEDSTRALAVLLAQRSDIVMSERALFAGASILFRKTNKGVLICDQGELARCSQEAKGGKGKNVRAPWLRLFALRGAATEPTMPPNSGLLDIR